MTSLHYYKTGFRSIILWQYGSSMGTPVSNSFVLIIIFITNKSESGRCVTLKPPDRRGRSAGWLPGRGSILCTDPADQLFGGPIKPPPVVTFASSSTLRWDGIGVDLCNMCRRWRVEKFPRSSPSVPVNG
ncbi:hypothetical protein QTP88_007176 [Uroleucon formosanum]